MGLGKLFKKVARIALPIIGTAIAPGIGTALGSTLSAAALSGIGGALGGAAGGALGGGGLKSALLGATLGGTGGYLAGGGSLLGSTAGSALGQTAQGPTQGSGLLGALTRSGSTLGRTAATGIEALTKPTFGGSGAASGAAAGGASGGSVFGAGNPLGTAISGYMEYQQQNDIEEQLRRAQEQALEGIRPYAESGAGANTALSERLAAGFDPSVVTSDPGYEFRLREGQRRLEQSLAAQGLGQSGAALKAAQEYGQSFANNEYEDAYNRWLRENQQLAQQSGQGLNAAGGVGDIYGNIGNIGANATNVKGNTISGALQGVLTGRGVIGWDEMGNPIYG